MCLLRYEGRHTWTAWLQAHGEAGIDCARTFGEPDIRDREWFCSCERDVPMMNKVLSGNHEVLRGEVGKGWMDLQLHHCRARRSFFCRSPSRLQQQE